MPTHATRAFYKKKNKMRRKYKITRANEMKEQRYLYVRKRVNIDASVRK